MNRFPSDVHHEVDACVWSNSCDVEEDRRSTEARLLLCIVSYWLLIWQRESPLKNMVSRVVCLGKSGSFFLYSTLHHLNSPSPLLASIGYRPRPGAKYEISAVHNDTASVQKVLEKQQDQPSEKWRVKMLYDGECPLCMREVNMLKERNEHFGTIKFVDISSCNYSSEENEGLDYKTVMGRIHAISYDGTILTDVAAFRRLYEEVGLGWVYAITKYEPIASIADAIYGVWAKYRLQLTGRPPLEKVLEERKKSMVDACENNACRM